MKSGKFWVIGLLALGSVAGIIAVTYWKSPRNSVRWSFTQIHSSLVRQKKDAAVRLIAPRVTWRARDYTAAEFVDAYALPAEAGTIEPTPCPSVPGHWTVLMKEHRYCFVETGGVWRLHWLGAGACACRP